MAEFAYNNTKNISTRHILFEFNCEFYPQVLFKEDVDSHSKSRLANKLTNKLSKRIKIYCQNLLHIHKLQKKVYDKGIKSRSYALDKKIWLNSKYIKIKRNKKLKNKFSRQFQVLHVVKKQAYKLKLPIK